MRINVYHHELPFMAERGCEHVRKVADTGITFHGARFYTEAPLIDQPGDDDSAALTFWLPWTKRDGHDTAQLREVAAQLVTFCDAVEAETGENNGNE